MSRPLLVIGNRNYSSWSLRPYMALKMAGISFDEKLVRFGEPAFSRAVKRVSKAARVPVLVVNGRPIWDSLAILEYAAELNASLWPKGSIARATARSICAEMHSGFQALRNECPMNIRRPPKAVRMSNACLENIKRIDQIWMQCRKEFGKGGPFLFGKFTNADAMFTPVASRFDTFKISVSKGSQQYVAAILDTPAYKSWKHLAMQEPWVYPPDEVD